MHGGAQDLGGEDPSKVADVVVRPYRFVLLTIKSPSGRFQTDIRLQQIHCLHVCDHDQALMGISEVSVEGSESRQVLLRERTRG